MPNNFTPGPWPAPEYDNDDCSGGYWYDIPGICRAIYTEENAKLIRATPDLLAVALGYQRVRAAQRAYFKSRSQADLIASKQAERELDAQASAAIAKATS